jgi:3-methyladenine DNA glycosylase/8-oxoguanine DNA glycosylase
MATTMTAPLPTVTRMSEDDYAKARRFLMRRDPMLGAIIKQVGPCRLHAYREGDLFSALCETIVSQQLSIRVAEVIFGRICALCTPASQPTPQAVLGLSPDQLRAAGLSRPKASYVHDLADKVASGTLDLHALEHLPDDEVIAALSTVKGIGRWSAQMILLFRFNRPDVWPTGDLGIVRALERFHRLRKTPNLQRLERLGNPWRPYRSVAAWYLWQSLTLPRT